VGIELPLKCNPRGDRREQRREREKLQKALRDLTLENDSKEKAIRLFMEDGYFDASGKLAQEYRQPE
jgi:hypothetical protein